MAVTHKTHIDTVLAYRKKYLENVGLEETNSKFLELNKETTIDWEKIKANKAQDKKLETHA